MTLVPQGNRIRGRICRSASKALVSVQFMRTGSGFTCGSAELVDYLLTGNVPNLNPSSAGGVGSCP